MAGGPATQTLDRARVAAYYRRRALGPGVTPSHPEDSDLAEQIAEWAGEGVRATNRFALECACGDGRIAAGLFRAGIPVLGVDLEPEMVRRAQGSHRKPPAAMFAVAATEHLPFRDGAFGAVIDIGAFRHYADPVACVGEWARVLAPRGALVIGDVVEKEQDDEELLTRLQQAAVPGAVSRVYKPFEIERHVMGAGFRIIRFAVFRERRTFAELDEECRLGGGEPGACRALLGLASPRTRELYEISGEEMTWRFMAFMARRS